MTLLTKTNQLLLEVADKILETIGLCNRIVVPFLTSFLTTPCCKCLISFMCPSHSIHYYRTQLMMMKWMTMTWIQMSQFHNPFLSVIIGMLIYTLMLLLATWYIIWVQQL